MTDAYERMEKLLLEEHVYLKPGMDFEELSRRAGADSAELEKVVMAELGMDGDELIETYRAQFFNVYEP